MLPDTLLTGSDDCMVRVWDTRARTSRVLQGHTNHVRALHWSYEACDSNFGGNSWVGMPPSPPAAASACPCIDTSHLFSGLIRPRRGAAHQPTRWPS